MIAYLMAAGRGERLRPLTDDRPKCLLPVGGKPMLEWWLSAVFKASVCDEVYVNVHHLADQVETWLWSNWLPRTGCIVHVIDERARLLGTAGTVYWHGDTEQDALVAYTDTWCEALWAELPAAVQAFTRLPQTMGGGLVSMPQPGDRSAGGMTVGALGTVERFKEKSSTGDVAWAGVLLARPTLLKSVRAHDADWASDVLPRWVNRLRVVQHVDATDMGRSVETYERLCRSAHAAA